MQIIPYLFFNGNCAEALIFYEQVLGATIEDKMLGADMPPDPEFGVPEDKKNWIMHAKLKIGDDTIMASDNLMETSAQMDGASVMLNFSTANEAKAIYDKLADGADITMPWAATFWSAGFGTLRDKFGVRWMIGCDELPAEA
ncbi:VOC family protein [Ahrensia sp. 13_GOM-1096m]|uniref:VOC family protein n=1 Tax=Ahrensia sp. 13_GOM-1096m TaxID=1380380 RepID=UPI00047875B7|nr:glyoxalase/bleomycin resistance/extradiol dioxygenase family protein [Ahrensia sp. 13_GOM-1096m]